jgi:hypothetical protein
MVVNRYGEINPSSEVRQYTIKNSNLLMYSMNSSHHGSRVRIRDPRTEGYRGNPTGTPDRARTKMKTGAGDATNKIRKSTLNTEDTENTE